MEVFRDKDGEINYMPIDFFPGAVDVDEWIREKISEEEKEDAPEGYELDRMLDRAGLYALAKAEYLKVSNEKDMRALRHNPRVVTNYDYGTEDSPNISYWFLFKEENNGSTYKILHEL